MTLEPLLSASPAIQFHVATVVPAAIIGAFLLAGQKGTRLHKSLGRVWIVLMILTSLSTFFIHTINQFHGFSLIHLLSLAVISGCVNAVLAARRGDIATHRRTVRSTYFGGIVIAGGFTLLPGRIMHAVIFDGGLAGAFWLALTVAGGLLVLRMAARYAGSGRETHRL